MNVNDIKNRWSDFKSQLVDFFNTTPSSPDASESEKTLGRVYLTDTLSNMESVEDGVAVTPTGVLDAVEIGEYVGNQIADGVFQTIRTKGGFTPRAVLISQQSVGFIDVGKKLTTYSEEVRGGLISGNDLCLRGCGQICEGGFKVANNNGAAELNYNGMVYLYIAFR